MNQTVWAALIAGMCTIAVTIIQVRAKQARLTIEPGSMRHLTNQVNRCMREIGDLRVQVAQANAQAREAMRLHEECERDRRRERLDYEAREKGLWDHIEQLKRANGL